MMSLTRSLETYSNRIVDATNVLEQVEQAANQIACMNEFLARHGYDQTGAGYQTELHSIIVPVLPREQRNDVLAELATVIPRGIRVEILIIEFSDERDDLISIPPLLLARTVLRSVTISTADRASREIAGQTGLCLALRMVRGITVSIATPGSVNFPKIKAALEKNLQAALGRDGLDGVVWRTWVHHRLGYPDPTRADRALPDFLAQLERQLPIIRVTDGMGALSVIPEVSGGAGKVSIIIPVWNQLDYTRECLDSIERHVGHADREIIVIDNGSTDGTGKVLESRSNITVITNPENRGFVEACNQAAGKASGTYLLFLNNDTIPLPGWLEMLVRCLEHDPLIWAAGSRLVYPNKTLQEAAALIHVDGTATNYGRHDNPSLPAYNVPCKVDYCSGASLMVREEAFRQMGGFDTRYSPAYYEETDLCFAIRDRGGEVIYEPASVVIHHGSKTAGTDTERGMRRYLRINREKFLEKWHHVLMQHEPSPQPDQVVVSNNRSHLGCRVCPRERVPAGFQTVEEMAALESAWCRQW